MDYNTCSTTGKKCFSQRAAAECLRGLKKNKKRRKKHSELPKRYYFCKFCGMFHLTHFGKKRV